VSALVRAELLKVRTVRSWWAYLIAIVLLVGIAVAGDTGSNPQARGELDFQVGLVESAGFAALLALILGIVLVTNEFRHGTITPTLLAAPVRELVLASKTLAATLLGAFFGVLALLVVAAVALTWLSIDGAEIHVLDGEVGGRSAQIVLTCVLWALLGVAIGTLVQSQVAALVGTLIWAFLGETLLWGLFTLLDVEGAVSYLPFKALDGADGTGGDDMLDFWPALAVSIGWIALLGSAGVWRLRRRDIT
jgi:ABC-type transport system involved in multi-copper enzyme maturation permease subunit